MKTASREGAVSDGKISREASAVTSGSSGLLDDDGGKAHDESVSGRINNIKTAKFLIAAYKQFYCQVSIKESGPLKRNCGSRNNWD